jgi:hypothetical protein
MMILIIPSHKRGFAAFFLVSSFSLAVYIYNKFGAKVQQTKKPLEKSRGFLHKKLL